MIKGQRTGLRAIEVEDIEPLRYWRNQPEFRQYFREYKEIGRDKQRDWYETVVQNDPNTHMFAITRLEDQTLLGACGLCHMDMVSRHADFSIYIGFDRLYIDSLYADDAAGLLLDYGFNTLGLHRIYAEIYSIDQAKQAFLPRLGFIKEGVFRQTRLIHGKWVDSLFYGLLEDEFCQGKPV